MTAKINSVDQLCKILYRIINSTVNPNGGVRVGWSDVFRVKGDTHEEILNKIIELISLFSLVKEDLSRLGNPYSEIGIEIVSKIETHIVGTGLCTNWLTFKSGINPESLKTLTLCSAVLTERGVCKSTLSEDNLAQLLQQIEDLIVRFQNSDLPNNFKLDLIDELFKIKKALINFDVTGEAQLQRVCNEVQGSIINKASQQPALFKEFKDSVKKVVSTAVTIGGLMTTYDLSIKYQPALTESIMNLIENLPELADEDLPKLEAGNKPQEMNAEIEINSNNQSLPASKK